MIRRSASVSVLFALLLAGCGGDGMDDLRTFVEETGKDAQGKIPPLPTIKPYEAYSYDAFDLPDPFRPRKLAQHGGGLQPDLDRPKEPLEAYSLETLKMVGVITRKGVMHAIVRNPDNAIYHVHVGNYLGQNFGLITRISENEVELREIVQDSAGDWSERTSVLNLQE